MEVHTIKLDLIQILLETDDMNLLSKVKKVLRPKEVKEDAKTIVGYHPDGTPITRAELWQDLENSLQQIKKGEVISMEELMKESENW